MPTTPRPKATALRIELLDIAPLVWRLVAVSNQSTLVSLHNYLQWVMGWMDKHAHEFHVWRRRGGSCLVDSGNRS